MHDILFTAVLTIKVLSMYNRNKMADFGFYLVRSVQYMCMYNSFTECKSGQDRNFTPVFD